MKKHTDTQALPTGSYNPTALSSALHLNNVLIITNVSDRQIDDVLSILLDKEEGLKQ